jgi:pimeloyl-ACP methyl ester carboxylesterase
MSPTPFQIHVPDAELEDLKDRLRRTRWPDEVEGAGWDYGVNLGYMRRLTEYWLNAYDWRAQERRLNALPNFRANVDGFRLHYVHIRGMGRAGGPVPMPLMLCHGWPSTFAEMLKVLGPLSDPASHGGDPDDAFDLVVPSLPGYGFSDRPTRPGMNTARVSQLYVKLMTETLGYERFAAQGGDFGGVMVDWMGYAHADRLIGISLTKLLGRRLERPGDDGKPSRRRTPAVHALANRQTPQTFAFAFNDSPVGLAAWIAEKYRLWGDPFDGKTSFEDVYSMDEILTTVMMYWITQTVGSAARLYYEDNKAPSHVPRGERVKAPMGAFMAPMIDGSLPKAEDHAQNYADIRRWTTTPIPGHFTAMEKPAQLIEEIRAFFRPLRASST